MIRNAVCAAAGGLTLVLTGFLSWKLWPLWLAAHGDRSLECGALTGNCDPALGWFIFLPGLAAACVLTTCALQLPPEAWWRQKRRRP